MTLSIIVTAGCVLSAVFGWVLRSFWHNHTYPEQAAKAYHAAFVIGDRRGYDRGYQAGYNAPVRRTLTDE